MVGLCHVLAIILPIFLLMFGSIINLLREDTKMTQLNHHNDHHHEMSTIAEVLLIILLVAFLLSELVVWIAASKDTSFMSTILTAIETGIH